MGKVILVNLVYDGVIYSNDSTVQNQVIFGKIQSSSCCTCRLLVGSGSYDEGPQERVDQAVVAGANCK